MKLNRLTAMFALLLTAVIQTGCGNANSNLYGYGQFQSACPSGSVSQNGLCMPQGGSSASACTSGPSYPMGPYGCAAGYVGQGSSCVCQAAGASASATPAPASAQCKSGYFAVVGMPGCYQQSNCPSGYALTPSGGMYSFYNYTNGGYCSAIQR